MSETNALDKTPLRPEDIIKDPYVLEFLIFFIINFISAPSLIPRVRQRLSKPGNSFWVVRNSFWSSSRRAFPGGKLQEARKNIIPLGGNLSEDTFAANLCQ